MLYRKVPAWAGVLALALTAVFVAGFFHESRASHEAPACAPPVVRAGGYNDALQQKPQMMRLAAREAAYEKAESAGGARADAAFFHVPANLYRRAGEFSCKVESVIKAYADIDKRIKTFGGEISEMEITGNDEGRRGRIACTVSTDKFNDFIDYARTLGKVLDERITATSRPKPQGGKHVPADDDVDPRELSIVTLSLMDEKVAKEVHESKGMLATSFNRSASHFLAGIAVLVEIFGWIAPYALMLALVIVPVVVVRRFRARREAILAPGAEIIR
jgi:hypothetical protein